MDEPHPSTKKSSIHDEFEKVWKEYPRKTGKEAARRCCFSRVAQGATWDQLKRAAQNYSRQCASSGTEERFIKHGSTFYGRDQWWKDYLQPLQASQSSDQHPLIAWGKKKAEDRFGDHV
jgi:hypothetical protein